MHACALMENPSCMFVATSSATSTRFSVMCTSPALLVVVCSMSLVIPAPAFRISAHHAIARPAAMLLQAAAMGGRPTATLAYVEQRSEVTNAKHLPLSTSPSTSQYQAYGGDAPMHDYSQSGTVLRDDWQQMPASTAHGRNPFESTTYYVNANYQQRVRDSMLSRWAVCCSHTQLSYVLPMALLSQTAHSPSPTHLNPYRMAIRTRR